MGGQIASNQKPVEFCKTSKSTMCSRRSAITGPVAAEQGPAILCGPPGIAKPTLDEDWRGITSRDGTRSLPMSDATTLYEIFISYARKDSRTSGGVGPGQRRVATRPVLQLHHNGPVVDSAGTTERRTGNARKELGD